LNQLGLGFLFTATDLASGVMGKVRNGFAQTRDEAGKFGTRSKEAFQTFARGASMMTAGVGGLMAFGAASAKATEFGHQIARVRTVIDEASLSTQDARDATMGLAATYGVSALQQADALYETISAGITDATQATQLLDVANQFAVGGTTDLKGAVDVLTSAVNTYSDTGLTAKDASDQMFTAIAAGKTTAAELSQSLGEVAPTAHAAGVGFDELQASIAALTVQGIKTPQAVTGLNAMLANLMKPTSDAAAEAKRLGIEFSATALKSKGLQGVMGQLAGNTKVNDETFVKLFGSIDGVKAALALSSNGGAKFNEIMDQMRSSSGATKKAFEIMSNTTKFQGDRFNALKENALILIGDALEPLKVSILKTVNSWVEAFNKMPKSTRDTIVKAIALSSAIVAAVGAVLMLKSGLSILSAAMGPVSAGASGIGAGFLPLIGIVGAVVVAIAAFKIAYDDNLGGLATKIDGFIEPIRTAWDALVQLFTTGTLDEALTQELLNGDNAAVNFAVKVKQTVDSIVEFFSGLGRGFEEGVKAAEPVFEAFGNALDELGAAFGGLVDPVSEVDAGFGEAGASGESAGGMLARLAAIIVDGLTIAIKIVTGFVSVWYLISDAFGVVGDAFGEVGAALGEVMAAFSGGNDAAVTGSGVWQTLGSILGGVVSVAIRLVGSQISFVAGLLSNFAQVARGVVDIVVGLFKGDWARVWKGAREIVSGVVAGIIDMVLGMVQFIADAADAIGAAFGQDLGAGKALKEFRAGAKEFVKGAMGLPHTEAVAPAANTAAAMFTAVPGAGLGAAPAVAAAGAAPSGPTTADWSIASTAAATAASRAAIRAIPPSVVEVNMTLNEEVLGRAMVSTSARAHGATSVDVG
jgi:TP901 family phage tail tape measure protein